MLPLEETILLAYLDHMRTKGLKGSSLNGHLSALGTFSEWAGFPRPRSSLLSYVIKGECKTNALTSVPPKSKVPFFPIDLILWHARGVVPRLLATSDKALLVPWAALLLSVVWCTRPATLMSLATDRVSIREQQLWLIPGSHKRKPNALVFRVVLPDLWL
jgi:hypothetical protein